MRVLIIEDDKRVADFLERGLRAESHIVRVCRTGTDGFEQAKSGDAELILLDVMLPYVDGFELIARLRSKSAWTDVPVIMLTSKSQEQTIVRALDAGANDYVVKPFRPDELMARLRRLLR